MRFLLRIGFVALIVLGVGRPAEATSILLNGDLNDPGVAGSDLIASWTLTESPLGFNATMFESFADRLGGGVGLWLRPFEGEAEDLTDGDDEIQVSADLAQIVPGIPGAEYALTGWALFEEFYSGGVDMLVGGAVSPTETYFALEFLDAGSSVLPGSVVLELGSGGQVNDGGWLQHTLDGIAPVGTVNVRVRAFMIDGVINQSNPQSAFFDDFSLEIRENQVVPEPASLLLIGSGLGALWVRRRSRRRRPER